MAWAGSQDHVFSFGVIIMSLECAMLGTLNLYAYLSQSVLVWAYT